MFRCKDSTSESPRWTPVSTRLPRGRPGLRRKIPEKGSERRKPGPYPPGLTASPQAEPLCPAADQENRRRQGKRQVSSHIPSRPFKAGQERATCSIPLQSQAIPKSQHQRKNGKRGNRQQSLRDALRFKPFSFASTAPARHYGRLGTGQALCFVPGKLYAVRSAAYSARIHSLTRHRGGKSPDDARQHCGLGRILSSFSRRHGEPTLHAGHAGRGGPLL